MQCKAPFSSEYSTFLSLSRKLKIKVPHRKHNDKHSFYLNAKIWYHSLRDHVVTLHKTVSL